jgi:hypothetical protein
VIRYNEPQPAIEAMSLRPVGRYAPASITSSMTSMMRSDHAVCRRRIAPITHSRAAITTSRHGQIASRKHRATRSVAPESSKPHNVAPVPAGSYLGGFRTPAPCLTLDLRRPALENLHHAGHSIDPASASAGEFLTRGCVGSEWRDLRYRTGQMRRRSNLPSVPRTPSPFGQVPAEP